MVFDDELAASHFLRVARRAMERARVEAPLLVSHRALLEREGPCGEAWHSRSGEPASGLPF